METIRLGVSACLLGRKVRYDGGHKHDRYVTDVLGPYVELVPVCPEQEVGMGVPREPVRLVRLGARTHLVGVRSGDDWTDRMESFATKRVPELPPLDGFVFKKDSPSCGVFRVKRFRPEGGMPSKDGRGLFAAAFAAARPLVPIEEEGRLQDLSLREAFVERLFAHARLRALLARFSVGALVSFHAAHKLQLLAHAPAAYASLGRLVASAKRVDAREAYAKGFMDALAVAATRPKHVNVLQHALGFFKAELSADEKVEAKELLADYRRGLLPLVVPITLLRHFVRKHGAPWLAGQTYLEPHPKELMLRNHP